MNIFVQEFVRVIPNIDLLYHPCDINTLENLKYFMSRNDFFFNHIPQHLPRLHININTMPPLIGMGVEIGNINHQTTFLGYQNSLYFYHIAMVRLFSISLNGCLKYYGPSEVVLKHDLLNKFSTGFSNDVNQAHLTLYRNRLNFTHGEYRFLKNELFTLSDNANFIRTQVIQKNLNINSFDTVPNAIGIMHITDYSYCSIVAERAINALQIPML